MTYLITGIPKDTNEESPIRQDVDDWYLEQTGPSGNRIQLTLFVEALIIMQNRSTTDDLSYFGLAGIHGAPWSGWGGQTSDHQTKDENFCVHNDYTFPTWHRVYMALFEQVVYEAMTEFINDKVPTEWQTECHKEAKTWRLPYWDFARFARGTNEIRLPIIATIPMVTINVFGSPVSTQRKSNPLYKFQTESLMGDLGIRDQGEEGPFHKCRSTTRYGLLDGYNEDVWADGGQNWLRANLALNEHPWNRDPTVWEGFRTLQEAVFQLLKTSGGSWSSFSSTKYKEGSEQKGYTNLEFIHNNIHNWVGGFLFRRPTASSRLKLWGGGHMASVSVAAFDPIFWLHHCNIDRLTAIWQKLNNSSWFDGDSEGVHNSQLTPFHNRNGNLFVSNDVRNWTDLNYDYAITKKDEKDIRDDIATLYGNKRGPSGGLEIDDDYHLNIKYDRYALEGSPFQINIFFGQPDGKDFHDLGSRNFVASVFNFSSAIKNSNCGNCIEQKKRGIYSEAQLPATLAVWSHQELEKTNKEPEVFYVVVNSRGESVTLDDEAITVDLYRINEGRGVDSPEDHRYKKAVNGRRATVDY